MPSPSTREIERVARRPVRRRRRLLLAATIIAVAMSGLGHAGAAGLPPTSLGVNLKVWYLNGRYAPTDLSLASGAGVGVVRTEAIQGTDMDGVVRWLAESRMRLYPTLGLPCPSGTANCTAQTQIPPATAASEMAQYITAFAQRYGAQGTFWSANPDLPYLPVKSFEIGNEPNIRVYWVQDGTHLHWDQPSSPLVADAADYAEVYEAARTALHNVDPTGLAVVGGLADSASLGVDVQSDEALLRALPRGQVDAVGYHPWVFDVSDSLLRPDTTDLRVWMDQNGFSGVPLDANELGACQPTSQTTDNSVCPVSQTSDTWGSVTADYTKWALCTPWLHVENVQPFVWGATPISDQDVWLPLVASNGAVTAYGHDFLDQAGALSASGCPNAAAAGGLAPANTAVPTIQGTLTSGSQLTGAPGSWSGSPAPTLYYQWERCDPQGQSCSSIAGANSAGYVVQSADVGSTLSLLVTATSSAGGATATSAPTAQVAAIRPATGISGRKSKTAAPVTPARRLSSMDLRVVRFARRWRRISLTVRHARGSGTVVVTVTRRGRRHRVRRMKGRRRNATTTAFAAQLSAGRWTFTIAGEPARGYAKPRPKRREITVAARGHRG
jgi:hypothetical protein